jgi:hypothetical protein
LYNEGAGLAKEKSFQTVAKLLFRRAPGGMGRFFPMYFAHFFLFAARFSLALYKTV